MTTNGDSVKNTMDAGVPANTPRAQGATNFFYNFFALFSQAAKIFRDFLTSFFYKK